MQDRGTKVPCRQKLLQKPIRLLCPLRTNFCCLHMLPLTRVSTSKKGRVPRGLPISGTHPTLTKGLVRRAGVQWLHQWDPSHSRMHRGDLAAAQHSLGLWIRSGKWTFAEEGEREMKQTFYQEPSRGAEGRIDSSKVFGCRSESSSYTASFCSHSGLAPW